MSKTFLSKLVHYRSYAKYLPEEFRRESKEETIERNCAMHVRKFPTLEETIRKAYAQVHEGRVVPSMRSFQFAGEAIERRNNRMFNCLRKSTQFITSQGVKTFEDFNDGEHVTVLTHTGSWKEATVNCHGVQQLNKITIGRGRSSKVEYATPEHTWLKQGGERTTNLQLGDKLQASENIFAQFVYEEAPPEERLYWCYGFVFGDGTRIQDKHGDYRHTMVRLCDHDAMFASRFEEMGFSTSRPLSCGGDIMAYTGSYLKVAPNPVVDSPELIRAFVAGYLAADGGKNGNNRLGETSHVKNHYTSIQSSEQDHIDFIRNCFPVAGVYIFREDDLTGQQTNFGVRPHTIRFAITNVPNNNSNCYFTVKDISPAGEEEVWCLNVEDDHSFVTPYGLVTGNCCFLNLTSFQDFADLFYMSMSGCGVGFSVKQRHISQLPVIAQGFKEDSFLIPDTAEGWCESLLKLLANPDVQMDYSEIRPMGAPLSTGGTASGPKALVKMHAHARVILRKAAGRQLTAFEAHRICCMVADCVVVGGVRRGALISLFDVDNEEMLNCKAGNWYDKYPELARSNNSASILKGSENFAEQAGKVIDACFLGGQAEPGLSLTNDDDYGWNPCHEVSLRSRGVCNLTEVNIAKCFTKEEFMLACEAAAIIGTLQASYTDFKYVHPDWKKNAELDALLGISITGQAENQQMLTDENLREGVTYTYIVNKEIAAQIGLRPAQRITTTKPSGTSSSWLGTTAGVHAGHEVRYVRRVRIDKTSAVARTLARKFPAFVVEDPDRDTDIIMQVPIKMYDTTLLRNQETAIQCLERVKRLYHSWIAPGHVSGPNTHNISLTINYHRHEEEAIKAWMLANTDSYYGISLIPFDGGDYKYLPYSAAPHPEMFDILEKAFNEVADEFDFNKIKEVRDFTDFKGEVACAGGACTID